jgi:predicted HAD superfamily phosphohydrolase YqeG
MSLVDLLNSRGKGWATHVVQTVQDAELEIVNFKILFFDIDDTLNAHGLGLNEACCELLNQYAKQYSVVLLTNCSQRRAEQHKENLSRFNCEAELWDVGKKPNHRWLRNRLSQKGWLPRNCAMFGDRPTMDLWCAYKAGFGGRFWVHSWAKKNPSNSMTERIKRWEWRQMQEEVS